MNKSEGKHKYVIQLNNLFKKRSKKPEASASNDAEEGKLSNDEEDNAAPSESTVIIEDEPQKKVRISSRKKANDRWTYGLNRLQFILIFSFFRRCLIGSYFIRMKKT